MKESAEDIMDSEKIEGGISEKKKGGGPQETRKMLTMIRKRQSKFLRVFLDERRVGAHKWQQGRSKV